MVFRMRQTMKQFRTFLTLALILSTTVPSQACCLFPWLTYRPYWGYGAMYGSYPAAYSGYGYGRNCGCYSPCNPCNPCGTCATGTCGATSTRKQPAPDPEFRSNGKSSTQDDTPRTFRRNDTGQGDTEVDDFQQDKWKGSGTEAGGGAEIDSAPLQNLNGVDDIDLKGSGQDDIPGLDGEFNTNKPAQEGVEETTEPPVEIDHETRKPGVTIPKEEDSATEQETGSIEFLGPANSGSAVGSRRSSQFEVLPISRMAGRSATQLAKKPAERRPTVRWISVPAPGRVRL